jgi:peptidoglycan/xylan/chitin deacetylase (PgdA/CDA1 family)
MRPIYAGVGAIFMLHHVRPPRHDAFQPNRHLEIAPEFLRSVLAHIRARDIDIVTPDEMQRRLRAGESARRFACFTFDDGYRDNRDHALAVMREFDAPMTVYVTRDFASGGGLLWWTALERVVARADVIDAPIGAEGQRLDAATPAAKAAAFAVLHDWLRGMPSDAGLHAAVAALCRAHGVDAEAIAPELCMSWDELRGFAADPLVTIGAHTLTHCRLAVASPETARREMADSRKAIETELQRPAPHLAYPYGDRSACGAREFALAREAGFQTAVTTRPGMIYAQDADALTALPRLSLNGNYQQVRLLPALTSGAATAIANGFRRGRAA